jgi:RecB family exonuclease
MSTFLKQLVDEILKKHEGQLENLCIVFPTRRAGLFFQKELSLRISTPMWSPSVYSIQDFLMKLSGKHIPDPLTLLFELYETYKQYFTSDDFTRFYPWGELMLRDFDEIDKYMIDASKVFSTVTDMHQIDIDFAMPEEDMERIRNFWKNFFDRDPSLIKNEFLNTWKHLHSIYNTFRKRLADRNISYEGMAYRALAGDIKNPDFILQEESGHIIFAGFYALSPSEQSILKNLIERKKASTYWDVDSYYADDPSQEAGKFIRKNNIIENNYLWKQDHFKNINKEIEIAGVPLMVGQAKYAGGILSRMFEEENFQIDKTAVVLPDEKLLFPLLYSLPENLQDINVTMGYPLRQTPLYDLFESLMILQTNSRLEKDGDVSFYFRDILNILNHPYIRLIADKPVRNWLSGLNQNFIRLPGSRLTGETGINQLADMFVKLSSVSEAFLWYKKILRMILEAMKEQSFRFHRLESEFVYHFYTQLKRLEDILKGSDIIKDISTFWNIFKEIISSVKIPFTGEPLKGLQVMGFLETRVLDFDNLIILSLNEDVLPSGGNQPSFIPYNLRKAFGLPTFEDQNAVSAFHFYRLLQRAKKIYLIHNTEAKALTTGERSRFILQIEHELKRLYPESIKINYKVISTQIHKDNIEELTIKKTPAVLKELSRFITNDTKEAKASLSASGLISYISCPMRFYFRYIAGMAEPEELEDNMEAATFGKVLHKAMQILYSGINTFDEKTISILKKKVNDAIDQAIHEEFISINQLEGKNILLRNVIRELVNRILESERLHVPFNILTLEKDVQSPFRFSENQSVRLFGIVDRVDQKDGVVRIVDYKTGKVSRKQPAGIADYFSDPAYKEQFQAMYYAYLTSMKMEGRQVKSGLLAMREMSDGIWFLNKDTVYTREQFNEFELQLSKLLTEIFSAEVPFTQTPDEKRCIYCAYKSLCNRN